MQEEQDVPRAAKEEKESAEKPLPALLVVKEDEEEAKEENDGAKEDITGGAEGRMVLMDGDT